MKDSKLAGLSRPDRRWLALLGVALMLILVPAGDVRAQDGCTSECSSDGSWDAATMTCEVGTFQDCSVCTVTCPGPIDKG